MRDARKKLQREKLEEASPKLLRIAIDCSLTSYYQMTEKVGGGGGLYSLSGKSGVNACTCVHMPQELRHLVRQICVSYGGALQSREGCCLQLVGLEQGGDIDQALRRHFPGYGTSRNILVRD